ERAAERRGGEKGVAVRMIFLGRPEEGGLYQSYCGPQEARLILRAASPGWLPEDIAAVIRVITEDIIRAVAEKHAVTQRQRAEGADAAAEVSGRVARHDTGIHGQISAVVNAAAKESGHVPSHVTRGDRHFPGIVDAAADGGRTAGHRDGTEGQRPIVVDAAAGRGGIAGQDA